ncbi:MAG: DUF4177 domain-containing protein [Verrucomicrobiales bacterium]
MQYEHRSHVIETSNWISSGRIDPDEIDKEIAEFGRAGFKLVTVIPISDGSVGTKRITLFFERELQPS